MEFDFTEHPHRRLNALNGDWILVSPHRTKRPWQGQVERSMGDQRPAYDPECYLCPTNIRAGGLRNPEYDATFVFTNDFAALMPDTPEASSQIDTLFRVEPTRGTCRVICFSPRHDLTLAEMDEQDIKKVVEVWASQLEELGKMYSWVQVFENKGAVMGCSNPHPHGQIWASNALPNEILKEQRQQQAYFSQKNSVLLLHYIQHELNQQERVVVENENWVVLVPFWAVWPFEVMVAPKRHILSFSQITDQERTDLARIMKILLCKYDNLFQTSFPYSMGWHPAPIVDGTCDYWQLHAHYYPPLLRSASVKKFMVGYEMMAEAQRDLTPEQAAARLRQQSDIHYKLVK